MKLFLSLGYLFSPIPGFTEGYRTIENLLNRNIVETKSVKMMPYLNET